VDDRAVWLPIRVIFWSILLLWPLGWRWQWCSQVRCVPSFIREVAIALFIRERQYRVDVRITNDVLSVEGRVDFSSYAGLQAVCTEYNVGNYARSFQLSSKIEQDAISAELKDGVMTLVLPKAEKGRPQRSRYPKRRKSTARCARLSFVPQWSNGGHVPIEHWQL
jgi:hypothetical protein